MKTLGIIITRTIGFPFFAALSLIGALRLWVLWIINYTRFGGEAIAYTDKDERKCINDIYHEIKKRK
jgi:hypothetical protein